MRTQAPRAHGRASRPRHLRDHPGYQLSGNEALHEDAELIESSRNCESTAVGEHPQCLLHDFLRTLINACPFSPDWLLRIAVLIPAESSRADGYDGNPRSAQFLFQGQRKRGEEGFGCGISAGKGNGLKTRSRGDIDDALLPSLQHSRKKAVGELDDGFIVEAKHFELPRKRKAAEFSAETEAGVVDEQVDRNATAQELLRQALACSAGR